LFIIKNTQNNWNTRKMITIFSFIPNSYIKCDHNGNPTISLFSSIKTSILRQAYTKWELVLVTNVENVLLHYDESQANDERIKIVYTSNLYLNLNTLFEINNNNNNNNNNNILNPKCKYVSFFDFEHDVWNVNKLQIQFNLMESSDYDVVGCECTHSTQCISALVPRTVKKYESSLFMSCPFLFSTALIKRELFRHYDEMVFQNEYEQMSDRNFILINTEYNTMMAQFHAFILYMTLTERNVYCIQYSNGSNSNHVNSSHSGGGGDSTSSSSSSSSSGIHAPNTANTLYNARAFNYSLVETSLQNKLTFLQESKTCDHLFFINAKQYFEEKFIRIRFFSDFCSPENCKQAYEEMCRVNRMDNYGPDKHLYITLNETYTHAILLNCPIVPKLSVPLERVLGLAFEPIPYLRLSYDFIHFAEKYVGLYYIGHIHPNLTGAFFKEHHGFMWHVFHPQIPPTLEEKYYKSEANQRNQISIIVSHKMKAPGNAYRHKLASFILVNNLPIDIWGNGTKPHSKQFPNHKNIKGAFKDKEPYESYTLSICIENYRHPHYFSEKISNCLVYNTTPIYLGCTKIDTYFPGQVIHLTGDITRDAKMLVDISNNPSIYIREIKHEDNDNVLNLLKNLPFLNLKN
jgi:hypothetical protein